MTGQTGYFVDAKWIDMGESEDMDPVVVSLCNGLIILNSWEMFLIDEHLVARNQKIKGF